MKYSDLYLKLEDILQARLLCCPVPDKLRFIIALESIKIKKNRKQIEYIVHLHKEDFEAIKEELDYLLYYILDAIPAFTSAHIDYTKENIVFIQEITKVEDEEENKDELFFELH